MESLAQAESRTSAADAVFKAVRDVNEQREEGRDALQESENQPLLAAEGVIDSLAFAFLVVTVEQYLYDDLDQEVLLFDDEVMDLDVSDPAHPFATLGSLINHVSAKLAA